MDSRQLAQTSLCSRLPSVSFFLFFFPLKLNNTFLYILLQFSSVQSLSRVLLFATPWIAARQASLSITNSQSSPRLTSIELVMPSSHLILCRSLLLLPPIPPSIRVFSNESTLRMRWPKYFQSSSGPAIPSVLGSGAFYQGTSPITWGLLEYLQ